MEEGRRRQVHDAVLVEAAREGDPAAFGQIFDAWLDSVYDVAVRFVRHPDEALDVTCRAFETAWRRLPGMEPPGALGAWLLGFTRDAAHERRPDAIPGEPTQPDDGPLPPSDALTRAATVDDVTADHEGLALLWAAGQTLTPRDLSVLDLCLRQRLMPPEAAVAVGLKPGAVDLLIEQLGQQLDEAVRAVVLWNGGDPICAQLAGRLDEAQIEDFDIHSARLIGRHAIDCRTCGLLRDLPIDPVAAFAAIPAAPMADHDRVRAVAALRAAGVPVDGSRYARELVGAGAAAGPGTGIVAGEGEDPPGTDATPGYAGDWTPPSTAPGSRLGAYDTFETIPLGDLVTSGERRRRRSAVLTAFGAGVIVALILGVVALGMVIRPDEGTVETNEASSRKTTTTTAASSTTVPTTTEAPTTTIEPDPTEMPASTMPFPLPFVPGAVPVPSTTPRSGGGGSGGAPSAGGGGASPVVTSPPPAPRGGAQNTPALAHGDIHFWAEPATVNGAWPANGPKLAWHIEGDTGASVALSGPGGFSASGGWASNEHAVGVGCPVELGGGVCAPPAGDYTYRISVTDSSGQQHARLSVTIHYNP